MSEETKKTEEKTIKELKEELNELEKEEIDERELKDTEATIFAGYKYIDYSPVGRVKVVFPSVKDDVELNRYYSEAYTDLLQNTNLLTLKQMEILLNKKGIWTTEDDKRVKELQELFVSKSVTLEQIDMKKRKTQEDKKNIKDLQKEIFEINKEFLDKILNRELLFENTLEKKAEEKMLRLKLIKCCFKEDDTPIWNNIDDLTKELANERFGKFLSECVVFWRGISVPLSETWLSQTNGSQDIE